MEPELHTECRLILQGGARKLGADVKVYQQEGKPHECRWLNGFRCPHGIQFWIEPTDAQHAEWERTNAP
jgi:hypothetical protein